VTTRTHNLTAQLYVASIHSFIHLILHGPRGQPGPIDQSAHNKLVAFSNEAHGRAEMVGLLSTEFQLHCIANAALQPHQPTLAQSDTCGCILTFCYKLPNRRSRLRGLQTCLCWTGQIMTLKQNISKSHPSRSPRSAPLLESKISESKLSGLLPCDQSEPPHSRRANLNPGLLARLQAPEESLDAALPVQLAVYVSLCHLA